MFEFVCNSLISLDNSEQLSLFPLAFSFALLEQLGIAPLPEEFLVLNNKLELAELFTCHLDNLPKGLTVPQADKTQLFNQIINHYVLHIPNFQIPNSLNLIRTILH